MRFKMIMAVMSALLLCSADSWAQPAQGFEHAKLNHEQQIERVYAQLGLSDVQKKLLKDNKTKHKDAVRSIAVNLRETMRAMGEELKKPEPDTIKLNALHAALKSLRDQMMDEHFNAILEVRKILTQDQFNKFIELMQKDKKSVF